MVNGEAVVVEWLLVFTGLAGLTAFVVDCGVVFRDCSVVEDGVCREEKLIKVVCEEPNGPIIFSALPLCTEKVPHPLSLCGPQHHLLSPQDTSLPLLSETGSSITTLSAGLLSFEQISVRTHIQAKSATSILVPAWVGASPTNSASYR